MTIQDTIPKYVNPKWVNSIKILLEIKLSIWATGGKYRAEFCAIDAIMHNPDIIGLYYFRIKLKSKK